MHKVARKNPNGRGKRTHGWDYPGTQAPAQIPGSRKPETRTGAGNGPTRPDEAEPRADQPTPTAGGTRRPQTQGRLP